MADDVPEIIHSNEETDEIVIKRDDDLIESNQMLINLKSVDNGVLINDNDYKFLYNRIYDPDGKKTKYFSLHYKSREERNWTTLRGVLTNSFTIVNSTKLIDKIKTELNAETIDRVSHYRSGTYVKSTFYLTDFDVTLNNNDDDEVDTMLLKLLTNMDTDISCISKCRMSFNIINGYSGASRLSLSFGLEKKVSNVNKDDHFVTINNVFLLDEDTKYLVHDGKLDFDSIDATNVFTTIDDRVKFFKEIPINDEFIEDFNINFPVKFRKKFYSVLDSIASRYHNLYYATFIWSYILDSDQNIFNEIRLRRYISNLVTVYRKIEQNREDELEPQSEPVYKRYGV